MVHHLISQSGTCTRAPFFSLDHTQPPIYLCWQYGRKHSSSTAPTLGQGLGGSAPRSEIASDIKQEKVQECLC